MAGIPVYTAASPTLDTPLMSDGLEPVDTELKEDLPTSIAVMTTAAAPLSATPEDVAPTEAPEQVYTSTAAAAYCPGPPSRSGTPRAMSYTPSSTPGPPTPGRTSAPYVPSHAAHARKASMPPPPPRSMSTADGMSVHPLPTRNTDATDLKSNFTFPAPPAGVEETTTFNNPFDPKPNQRISQFTPRHKRDLSSPPGYVQNYRASFQDSSLMNPYTNDSPYASNAYSPYIPAGHTHSRSVSMSPMRGGQGILDNDPSIYLPREGSTDQGMFGFGSRDEVWDTASKWARAAGKRLSVSDVGLWKLVSGERS